MTVFLFPIYSRWKLEGLVSSGALVDLFDWNRLYNINNNKLLIVSWSTCISSQHIILSRLFSFHEIIIHIYWFLGITKMTLKALSIITKSISKFWCWSHGFFIESSVCWIRTTRSALGLIKRLNWLLLKDLWLIHVNNWLQLFGLRLHTFLVLHYNIF